MSLSYFDKILYINLDHRKDRKKILLDQLAKLDVDFEKVIRISACLDSLNGYKGTVLSHIKALDYAIENKLDNVLILEDDCLFIKSKNTIETLMEYFFEKIKSWDVFLLGGKYFKTQKTKYPHIIRILKSYDCHAYVVNSRYFQKLKKCFLESYDLIKDEIFYLQSCHTKNAVIDVYWNKMQIKDSWYSFDCYLTIQDDSFSDNTQKARNYNREIKKVL